MRKNFTSLLQKGSLTPKERSLMIVQDTVASEREGKGFLSDADKYALVEGWQPKDNFEAKEYNKYNDGWRMAGYAELDAQTTFLQAQNAFLRVCIAAGYYLHADYETVISRDNELFDWSNLNGEKSPNAKEALDSVLENSGLQRDYMVYRYAFESMDKGLLQDLLKLYPDVMTESDYLYSELALYELLGGAGKPNDAVKESIADMIVKRAYNEYAAARKEESAHEGRDEASALNPWSFHGYFGDIPLLAVAKKCAEYNEVALQSDEDDPLAARSLLDGLMACALQRETDLGDLIKQAALRYLDEGLLDEYPPLFLSDSKETVNGEPTTLTHKEVFKLWLEAKTKADREIKAMLDEGKLDIRRITDELFGVKREQETILGKSLYRLEGVMAFVNDYKRQAEALVPVGFLFEIIKQSDLTYNYSLLLGFEDIFKRLSIVYDVDLTYKVQGYLATIRKNIEFLNDMLQVIKDKYASEAYLFHDCHYFMDVPKTCFIVDIEAVKPEKQRLAVSYKKLKETLGNEF